MTVTRKMTTAARDRALVEHVVETARLQSRLDFSSLSSGRLSCSVGDCARTFAQEQSLRDHAEAVHTFDDIRRLVSEFVREKFGRQGDYRSTPAVPGVWTWIEDLSTDWVVFQIEDGNDTSLQKASYSITDGAVTLGDPVEVRRRTVYEAVGTSVT